MERPLDDRQVLAVTSHCRALGSADLGSVLVKRRIAACAVASAVCLSLAGCGPAPGDLDGTWGSAGVATTRFSTTSFAVDAVALPSGKVVAVGTVDKNGGDVALARYNVNGSADTTFGGYGTGRTTLD